MDKVRINDKEDVARMLKDIWFCDGEVSPAAFFMRPHLAEFYLSVLREGCESFSQDASIVVRGRCDARYASMNVAQIRNINFSADIDFTSVDVFSIDNRTLKSHAGIFLTFNGQTIVAGEPFESFVPVKGMSSEDAMFDIGEQLAFLARNSIRKL